MFARPAKVLIILLNNNEKKETLECLASLEKVDYPNFQTIVVDHGSRDDSVAKIRLAYPNIPILETKIHFGFAEGNNIGIKWALRHHAEWIVLLHNHSIVSSDFLTEFLSASEQPPKPKILGAKILRYDQPHVIDHLGGFWNGQKGELGSYEIGTIDHPYLDMRSVPYVCGAALMMHRTVPEKVGLLEPKFSLFWQEADLCYRARRAGFPVWTAPRVKVWSKISSSLLRLDAYYFWWRSRLLWIAKNCTSEEKKQIYQRVIFPDLWKMARHYLLKNLFTTDREGKETLRRHRAGCAGAIDYFRGRFGDCPAWILQNQRN